MKIHAIIIGLAISLQVANAGSYEDALQAIEKGDHAQGYTLLEPLAEAGDAEARYLIGNMIIDKMIPAVDQERGVYWLEQAVECRHMAAAQALSKMYLSGYVVPFDSQKGVEYQALANDFRPDDEPVEECD